MESSRIESPSSKMEVFLKDFSAGFIQQQINHSFCSCQLCVNNVKPIPQPEQLREVSQKQVNLSPVDAFFYVLSKCMNYKGALFIPEIIFLQEGTLFYTNQWGRLRTKDKLTNQEAKKFFDQKRQKTKSFRSSQRQKESYLLVYKSGTQQVMNQAYYNKILSKRKNDPFWLEATYSYKMPEPKDKQSSLKVFSYKRTKSKAEYMIRIMEKIMKEVDSNDEKLNRQQTLKNISYMSLDDNLLNSIQVPIAFKSTTSNNLINSAQMQMANSQHFLEPQSMGMKTQRSKFKVPPLQIKDIVQEIVAYLQVTSKIRVLQLQLQYTQDSQGQPVIIHFQKFISYELSPNEECYLHDRYKDLETIKEKELIELKKYYDAKDEESLWSVCIEILQSCLQQRKIKLRVQNYKRPTKKASRQIYTKFFPEFSPYEMFQNVNWKNELPKFMSATRQKINDIIQSDEGISILKRFDIFFYRTF